MFIFTYSHAFSRSLPGNLEGKSLARMVIENPSKRPPARAAFAISQYLNSPDDKNECVAYAVTGPLLSVLAPSFISSPSAPTPGQRFASIHWKRSGRGNKCPRSFFQSTEVHRIDYRSDGAQQQTIPFALEANANVASSSSLPVHQDPAVQTFIFESTRALGLMLNRSKTHELLATHS